MMWVINRSALSATKALRLSSPQSLPATRYVATATAISPDEPTTDGVVYPEGWATAKKYTDIPGPNRLQMFRAFIKGGRYHNITPLEMQQRILDDYGPLVRLPGLLGRSDMLFCFDPKHFETIYRTEGVWPRRMGIEAFDYYRTEVRPDIFKGRGGLITDQGETWHQLRSVANPVMMAPRVTRSYVPEVDAVARDFVHKVHRMRDDTSAELPATFGNELNLWALESIGVIALDRRLGVMAYERDGAADLLIRTMKNFFKLSYSIELKPAFWKYYYTKEFKQLLTTLENMTSLTMQYINESMEQYKQQNEAGVRTNENSVLQKMLSVNRDYAILMTLDMMMAGIDTAASTMASMLYDLAKNPDAQERLREEVLSVVLPADREQPLTKALLDRMPYMRACMKESMRMHPINGVQARNTGQPLIIEGYQVPKDTDFIMNTLLLMNDETHYKQPYEFQPDRWLRDSACAKELNPFVFLPFGFGARSCVGRRFAEIEIQVLLTRILLDYRVEWHHGIMEYENSTFISSPCTDLKFKFVAL